MGRQTIRAYVYLAYLTLLTVVLYVYTTKYSFPGNLSFIDWSSKKHSMNLSTKLKLKYILQWTSPKNMPFVYMGVGQRGFIERNCSYTNCYVSSDKNFFLDYTKFDVIAFAGPEVIYYKEDQLPVRRSAHQKYVFANIESAYYYPVCRKVLNGFFNWTWTYKLDSDLRWGYIIIKDKEGNIVGPMKDMCWRRTDDMFAVSDALKKILKGKTKLAAWFVSNCVSASDREGFVFELNKILQTKYKSSVDIYGECGSLECSRDNETVCHEMITRDYYFYLSFENAFSEDYVTEKLLNAVQHYAVPVVFGGANYSRFLPNGSYLNAVELGPEKLAAKMHQLMNSFDEYVEFFRWTNHYSYHRQADSPGTDEYCKMCELLNDEERVKKVSVYTDLRSWWDPPDSLCYGVGDVRSVGLKL